MNTFKKGRQYEQKACEYLFKKGYKILRRNYSATRSSEVDIVALDGDWLVAVEVKGVNAPWAEEFIYKKVNRTKVQKISRAIELFLHDNPQYEQNYARRIDVVLITDSQIIHYKDVQ